MTSQVLRVSRSMLKKNFKLQIFSNKYKQISHEQLLLSCKRHYLESQCLVKKIKVSQVKIVGGKQLHKNYRLYISLRGSQSEKGRFVVLF